MFLNQLTKKQQGFLMPLAIFIIVVMGTFALVISRSSIQTSTATTQEAISTQTFYAAESGAQRGMQVLFFTDASVRQQVDTRCTSLNATYTDTVSGLKNCSTVVTCSCLFQDGTSCSPITASNYTSTAASNRLTSFYKISSEATCGVGNLRAVRTIEAGSFLKQE